MNNFNLNSNSNSNGSCSHELHKSRDAPLSLAIVQGSHLCLSLHTIKDAQEIREAEASVQVPGQRQKQRQRQKQKTNTSTSSTSASASGIGTRTGSRSASASEDDTPSPCPTATVRNANVLTRTRVADEGEGEGEGAADVAVAVAVAVPLQSLPDYYDRCVPIAAAAAAAVKSASISSSSNGNGNGRNKDEEIESDPLIVEELSYFEELTQYPCTSNAAMISLSGINGTCACSSAQVNENCTAYIRHSKLNSSEDGMDNDMEDDEEEEKEDGECCSYTLTIDDRNYLASSNFNSNSAVAPEISIPSITKIYNQDAGYLVGDYCGIHGYEQILFLPPTFDADEDLLVSLQRLRDGNGKGNRNGKGKVKGGNDSSEDTDSSDDEMAIAKERGKERILNENLEQNLLRDLLKHCVLTDGTNLMFHSDNRHLDIQKADNSSARSSGGGGGLLRSLEEEETEIHIRLTGMNALKKEKSNTNTNTNVKIAPRGKKRQRSFNANGSESEVESEESDSDESIHLKLKTRKRSRLLSQQQQQQQQQKDSATSTRGNNGIETVEYEWQKKIRLGKRKHHEREMTLKQREHNLSLLRQKLIQQSRNVLQDLSLESSFCRDTSSSNKSKTPVAAAAAVRDRPRLKMVRLKYATRPTSTFTDNALSVQLQLEVDVLLSSLSATGNENENGNMIGNSSNNHDVYDVQLSCKPIMAPTASIQAQENIAIQTQSAVVPTFGMGQCVTIMASAAISGIQWTRIRRRDNEEEEDDSRFVKVSVTAHFRNMARIPKSNDVDMKGVVLGHMSLPLESILFSKDLLSGADAESMKTIDFPTSDVARRGNPYHSCNPADTASDSPQAIAIYEYRPPMIITIDVSNSISGNIYQEWQDLATSINNACSKITGVGGNRVDVQYENHEIKLIIMAETPHQRACMVELVLRYLPDGTKIINQSSLGNEAEAREQYYAKSLVSAAVMELDTLSRHTVQHAPPLSREGFRDIVAAQNLTDEIASRLLLAKEK